MTAPAIVAMAVVAIVVIMVTTRAFLRLDTSETSAKATMAKMQQIIDYQQRTIDAQAETIKLLESRR